MDPARAPQPAGAGERLVFRQLYQTLVRVDCSGASYAGLAASWTSLEGGRVWIFTLRPGERFWDGNPVTARAVADAWAATRRASDAGAPPWTWIRPESVRVLTPERLSVNLPFADSRGPELFADPALAVAKRGKGRWPVGTGPFRVDEGASSRAEIVLRPSGEPGTFGTARSSLHVRTYPGADARDVLAHGLDAVVVRDRSAVDYADQLPGYAVRTLPWDRLYLVVSPLLPGSGSAAAAPDSARLASELAFRREIARDVAVADARAAAGFAFDEDAAGGCLFPRGRLKGGVPPPPPGRRILYPEGDADAKTLAARLVALATGDISSRRADPAPPRSFAFLRNGGGTPLSVGIAGGRMIPEVRSAGDAAYVLPVERNGFDPCLQELGFLESVNWLGAAASRDAGDSTRAVLGRGAIPLVVTRSHLVIRVGIVGIDVDGDGIPLFERAGWTTEGALP